jgi:hypothetical protein
MLSRPSFFAADAVVSPMQGAELLQLSTRDMRISQALYHHDIMKRMKKVKEELSAK